MSDYLRSFLVKVIQTFNIILIKMNEATTEVFEAIQDTHSVIYQALKHSTVSCVFSLINTPASLFNIL